MTVRQGSRKAINSPDNAQLASILATGLKSWLNIKVGTFYFLSILCFHLHFLTLIFVGGRQFSLRDQIGSRTTDNSKYVPPGHWMGQGDIRPGQGQALMWPAKVSRRGIFCRPFRILDKHLRALSGSSLRPILRSAKPGQKIGYWNSDFLWNPFDTRFRGNYITIRQSSAWHKMTKSRQTFQFPFPNLVKLCFWMRFSPVAGEIFQLILPVTSWLLLASRIWTQSSGIPSSRCLNVMIFNCNCCRLCFVFEEGRIGNEHGASKSWIYEVFMIFSKMTMIYPALVLSYWGLEKWAI